MREIPNEIVLILAALLAGIASYAQKYIDTKVFRWVELVAHLTVSLFSAYIFTIFTKSFTADQNMIQLANALGAFSGVKGVSWMQAWFKKKFL